MTARFLSQAEILERIPVCRETLRSWIASGRFPAPTRIGQKLFWSEAAWDAWAQQQAGELSEVVA